MVSIRIKWTSALEEDLGLEDQDLKGESGLEHDFFEVLEIAERGAMDGVVPVENGEDPLADGHGKGCRLFGVGAAQGFDDLPVWRDLDEGTLVGLIGFKDRRDHARVLDGETNFFQVFGGFPESHGLPCLDLVSLDDKEDDPFQPGVRVLGEGVGDILPVFCLCQV